MKVPVPETIPSPDDLGRVHFVGIGGAGLSGIARIMLGLGLDVSGSDQNDSATLEALREAGARVFLGHRAEQVDGVDTVVVSTAVSESNPEYRAAVAAGLRILPRSAALAAVMTGRRTVAVAGTHGKTTTTSLLTVALQAAGADPTYAIGGDLTSTGVNAALGSSDLFVAEADESDGAFLVYSPWAAIVTNIDADHLDQWGTEAAYQAAFKEFVARIDPAGFLVTWADSATTRELADVARAAGLRVLTYGQSPDADLHPDDLLVGLRVPGQHYVLNALAAMLVGRELGFEEEALSRGLAAYTGTKRRMELKGEVASIRVYDSYAHHPTEIDGDLEAARSLLDRSGTQGRLIVAFQPHLVSRTRIFAEEMGRALSAADEVVVTDVYLAREAADPEVTGGLVANAIELPAAQVSYVPELSQVAATLADRAAAGDLVLTLGAGTITAVGPQVLELLEHR